MWTLFFLELSIFTGVVKLKKSPANDSGTHSNVRSVSHGRFIMTLRSEVLSCVKVIL